MTGVPLGLHEDCVSEIHKYCLMRPAVVETIVDRVVWEFCAMENQRHFLRDNKALMEDLRKKLIHIPEGKTQSVDIHRDHAKTYLTLCQSLKLNPIDMLTFQTWAFLKTYDFKKKIELNKERNMEEWGDPRLKWRRPGDD